jgi:hypothetical protein
MVEPGSGLGKWTIVPLNDCERHFLWSAFVQIKRKIRGGNHATFFQLACGMKPMQFVSFSSDILAPFSASSTFRCRSCKKANNLAASFHSAQCCEMTTISQGSHMSRSVFQLERTLKKILRVLNFKFYSVSRAIDCSTNYRVLIVSVLIRKRTWRRRHPNSTLEYSVY